MQLLYFTYINTIQINKILEKRIRDVDKKIADVCGLVTTTGLDTKIKEVDKKCLTLVV